ncbi:MAG: LytTR family DNA-binding domain-containing protein [Planctomycetota bacterium]
MRILIVEDEKTVAQRLERLLRDVARPAEIDLHRCATLEAAKEWLESTDTDAVFLDLNLNGEDGFDLLRDLASRSFHTVVVSGHVERALEAFEVGALDFVPKPFGAERLAKTYGRLMGARAEHASKFITVRSPGSVELIPVREIQHVRAFEAGSELVLVQGPPRLHPKPLDRLQSLLPEHFVRVHRSYIVRLDLIERLRVLKGSRYSVLLRSGEELPVGRTRVEGLRRHLGDDDGYLPQR